MSFTSVGEGVDRSGWISLFKAPSRKRTNFLLFPTGNVASASWAVLGDPKRLWRHLGLSWKRLGGVLEGSWRPLGRSLAEKGGQHGSNLVPKTEPKSIKNRSQNRSIC